MLSFFIYHNLIAKSIEKTVGGTNLFLKIAQQGFLHIDEYPPDANQGFDIPSALISFPNHHASLDFKEELSKSPLLSKFKVEERYNTQKV